MVVGSTQLWQDEYPFTLQHRDTTLHFQSSIEASTRQAFEHLIEQRSTDKRISAPLDCTVSKLFTKRERLDSLRKKWRVQRGSPKRNGMYDWSLEELINTREAALRGAPVPKLKDFGYRRSKLGLIQDVFLITEFLADHVDGLTLVREQPQAVHRVIEAAFELLHALHGQGITHMDLWAANVMLSEKGEAQAIDLENSFSEPSQYLGEILGFQFGFFYRREIYRYITEADYDVVVERARAKYFSDVAPGNFEWIYELAKHEDIGRLERRELFTRGSLNASE